MEMTGPPTHPLTVGDLFCGAGGFSEGFRQAGFITKWAVEFWPPAIETYQKNHPLASVYPEDVLTISGRTLPHVDVVIGSPPCTQFSPANRGGNGDKEEGLGLARRFFEIVRQVRPKYWILENVPALRFSLAEELEAGRVETRFGTLQIPRISVLNATDFGTPQRRHRLFIGDYPELRPANREGDERRLSLRHVIDSFPDPTRPPPKRGIVKDPFYSPLRVPVSKLRDHFEDTRWKLRLANIKLARAAKQEHRWLGKMVFPDDLNKPSRTITGAHSTTSRSSIIFRYREKGRNPYRTLTLREAATIQGFPISYQFWHDSFGGKDQLVGNAVPVPVARALAHAILKEEGLVPPPSPLVFPPDEVPDAIRVNRSPRHRFGPNRRFRLPVPIDVRKECRVELDNAGTPARVAPATNRLWTREWVTRLYLGYAKEYLCYQLSANQLQDILGRVPEDEANGRRLLSAMADLLEGAHRAFDGRLPDSTSLQERWTERTKGGPTPLEILGQAASLVNRTLPRRVWEGVLLPEKSYLGRLGNPVECGRKAPDRPTEGLPVRTLGAALTLTIACDSINR